MLCGSTGTGICFPVPVYVAGNTPAGSRLIRLQFIYGFAKYIPNDLCERLWRGVHESSQLLDASLRCHNGLLNNRVPAAILVDQPQFAGITPRLGFGPPRIL